jgi:hypothetical protein
MKKTIFLLIALTLLFFSCKKKYEDGPAISLRSVTHRLYGVHQLTSYTVDGVESIESYNDSLGLTFTIEYSDYREETFFKIDGKRKDGKETALHFDWMLLEKGTYISIYDTDGDIGIGPFGLGKKPLWHILRLTDDELKMKTDFIGKEYVVFLEK